MNLRRTLGVLHGSYRMLTTAYLKGVEAVAALPSRNDKVVRARTCDGYRE